jgi:UDP-N-acetylmuramoylalanine--D-glutamate ligase
VTENGMAWLVRAHEADDTPMRGKGRRKALVEDDEIMLQRLMPADALRVRGRHNAANALAALALATAVGCPLAPMLHGLREYAGEPHRVAFVGTVGGVDAYDDSKGTNVGATVAALDGLGADQAPARLVLILGGDGKGQDFSPLIAPLQRHARAVVLIGRDGPVIGSVIGEAMAAADIPVLPADDLDAAVTLGLAQARPGDALLLSPACASLDMFRNYAHRAEVFCAAVQRVADEAGELL